MNRKILLLNASLLLTACGGSGHDDLKVFIDKTVAEGGGGNIDPIPTFSPYKPFDYSATLLRAPFDQPIVVVDPLQFSSKLSVKPDENRLKEYLEGFGVESLVMVGTLEQDGEVFALVNDPQGSIHYVKEGDYMGRNHGKIMRTTATNIQLMEIISAGGGWVERPRTLKLREVE
ncbi:MAG: pilus assembly protein PilP [Sinobacterium sp.]|nr:pilus assembly protein PilP [Sinobacterium sp.]